MFQLKSADGKFSLSVGMKWDIRKAMTARTFLHTDARTIRSLLPDEVNSFDLNFAYTISTLESLCLDMSVFSP